MVALFTSQLFAAQHTSVPVDHLAYTIIKVGEIRALIDKQAEARPFSAYKVISLLEEMKEQKMRLSKSELIQIQSTIDELHTLYGTTVSTVEDLFSTGFLRTYDEKTNIGASLGINITTQQTALIGTKEIDSRNSLSAFIKGDLGKAISFNMNFGLLFDQLNNRPFLDTEFTIPCDGFYMQLTQGGDGLYSIPDYEFYTGIAMSPEIAATFLDGKITLRWGGVKRDWGAGLNNLLISKNARSFNGIDISIDITPWLRYSVVNGALGIFSLHDIDGEPFFSDKLADRPYYRFDNNISAHRIEIDATKNLTLSIYEAVVWKKRFELGYLNPISIYMFEQNNLGDLDDVLAGLDFSLMVANKVKLYGSIATSEMNSFKNVFTTPRNILAFQTGVVVPLPIGNFSTFTFQWTYLSPFFYSHYPTMEKVASLELESGSAGTFTTDRGNKIEYNDSRKITKVNGITFDDTENTWLSPNGRLKITKVLDESEVPVPGEYSVYEAKAESAYVHKGESLGYPLHPNSQEFLAQLFMMFPQGWRATASATYQARSGQYGYEIEQYMIYSKSNANGYPDKDFWNNIFEHLVTIKLEATKSFNTMPIEINGSYRFTTTWERGINNPASDGMNDGFGGWTQPSYDHVVSLGARIFL